MKEDLYCEVLCKTNVGHAPSKRGSDSELVRGIKLDYHNNWIVDNLPAAYRVEEGGKDYTTYTHGFPIGFVNANKEHILNNHVNIMLRYHQVTIDKEIC